MRELQLGGPSAELPAMAAEHAVERTAETNGLDCWTASRADSEGQQQHEPPTGIVAEGTFIVATRDTGYRSVAAAVSELIDNALQAGARHVQLFVQNEDDAAKPLADGEGPPSAVPVRRLVIAVLDDGEGMPPALLRQALQFGGTSRFNDRSGLGRFGMGLPNSSVSQSRRLDVYSWQAPRMVYHSYLDVDEVAAGQLREIPPAARVGLPDWAVVGAPTLPLSGTLVVWGRCDRLGRRRAGTLVERLRIPLGRTYRYTLWKGTKISLNGVPIEPIDPLFTHARTAVHGAIAYGAPLIYEIGIPGGDRTSNVEVRFTELPVAHWHSWPAAVKRKSGIVGGAGVSIVRAGREIDFGWYLMGDKRRENYDDWWRCEIRFTPELDELFGVTHSKQGITPSAELRSLLEPDLEGIARTLNARVRVAFEQLKAAERAAEATPAVRTATEADRFLPQPARIGAARRTGSSSARGAKHARRPDGLRYTIEVQPIDSPEFFRVVAKDGVVVVIINRDHPFFARAYEPSCEDPTGRERFRLECLLLAAARAELSTADVAARRWASEMRHHWGDALAAFLEP